MSALLYGFSRAQHFLHTSVKTLVRPFSSKKADIRKLETNDYINQKDESYG